VSPPGVIQHIPTNAVWRGEALRGGQRKRNRSKDAGSNDTQYWVKY
jgi:hypothetical protein